MIRKIEDLMPQSGLFPLYVEYARKLTDAPELFHLGTALAMFSAAVAPKVDLVYLDGKSKTPINLWVLLLAPSGDRKSTAIQIGDRTFFWDPEDPTFGDRAVPTMCVGCSPEATFDLLAKHPNGILLHPEASTLFQRLRSSVWSTSFGFLCDLYDGRDSYKRYLMVRRTKRNPNPAPLVIEIKRPRVAFLSAASPDSLATAALPEHFTGGLIGRMLPLYDERNGFNAFPMQPKPRDEKRIRKLFARWVESATTNGNTVSFSPHAWEMYRSWGRRIDLLKNNYADDKRGMVVRLMNHVLRVAALYRLGSPSYEDDCTVMGAALAVGEVAMESILRLPPTPERKRRRK